MPEAVRLQFKLGPFYQKHLSLDGFPILGSAKVAVMALRIVGREPNGPLRVHALPMTHRTMRHGPPPLPATTNSTTLPPE